MPCTPFPSLGGIHKKGPVRETTRCPKIRHHDVGSIVLSRNRFDDEDEDEDEEDDISLSIMLPKITDIRTIISIMMVVDGNNIV